jgi:cysteine desulfurase / selenocysteine lyase
MPRPVYERTLQYYAELGGFADFSWNRWLKRREDARNRVAEWLHASPDEIAFTSSTSHGMNLIAELIAHKGTVLTNTLEFPATTIPWIHRKAKIKFLKPVAGIVSTDQIKRNLTRKVKTIAVSLVQYQNGCRQDLEAIGRAKGNRFFVVNASQGFGYLPIHVRRARIDFLATNCYKWMLAGYGSGILYVNRKWLKKFKPRSAGWRSVVDPEGFDNRKVVLKSKAARYELGCPSFPQYFAVSAALEYFSRIGRRNIERRIFALTDFLIRELTRSGFEIMSPTARPYRSGIVVFKVKHPKKVTKQLLAKRIYVSPRGNGIRVAPHMYNTEGEIRRLMTLLKKVQRS